MYTVAYFGNSAFGDVQKKGYVQRRGEWAKWKMRLCICRVLRDYEFFFSQALIRTLTQFGSCSLMRGVVGHADVCITYQLRRSIHDSSDNKCHCGDLIHYANLSAFLCCTKSCARPRRV